MFDLQEKLIAWAAGTAVVLIGCWYLRHSGYVSGENACRAEMAERVEKATAQSTRIEQSSEITAVTLEAVNVSEHEALERRYRDVLARYERLRASASSSPVPQAVPDAPVSDAGGDGRGHAGADDPDPRPAFALYGRDAESLRLSLRTCQAYGREIERLRAQIDALNAR